MKDDPRSAAIIVIVTIFVAAVDFLIRLLSGTLLLCANEYTYLFHVQS